jgi:hypothetical protein
VNSWTLSRAPYQSQNGQQDHRADSVDDRGNNASANYDADLRQTDIAISERHVCF